MLRRRKVVSPSSGVHDNNKTIKVLLILTFLLFVLYLLSFGLNRQEGQLQPSMHTVSGGVEDLNQADELDKLELTSVGDGVESEEGLEAEIDHAKIPFSIADIPSVPESISVVGGFLTNMYRHPSRDNINSRLELPRVFQFDPRSWIREKVKKRTVCVYTRTPRQDSLFKTNMISMFGTGQYNYQIMRSTDCQHYGTCKTPEEARSHPKCDPHTMPTIHLLERIKNFGHERFAQVLSNGLEYFDVLVATGDEFCRATNTYDRAHFRNYYGPTVTNSSYHTPIYIPLGAREEFQRVLPREVKLMRERRYVFNFLGSITSNARNALIRVIRSKLKDTRKFLHVIQKWNKKLTPKYGYVAPAQYKQVLLNSIFTLCPQGHNPEAYRIFEACESGSIPIVVLDEFYRQHECDGAYAPLITQGAPFVFLNSWAELPSFLEMIYKDTARLQQMQADVMGWYAAFMKKVSNQFETVLMARFEDRADKGKFTGTAHLPSIEAYLDDPKYIKPLV